MTGSHGCVSRTAPAWLGAALTAAGLLVASGPSTARANPISADAGKPITPPVPAARPAPGSFEAALGDFVQGWEKAHPDDPSTPPKMSPLAAGLVGAPATGVSAFGKGQPCGCPPPPPCSCATPPAPPGGTPSASPPAPQVLTPPSPSTVQATPEPSTVVSALALIGAVAWRRRAARARG